jgi:prolyl-tRNA synthetase
VSALARELADAGVRARVDSRTDVGLGRRLTDWELKGVPVRVEIGPRDLRAGALGIVRRDNGERAAVPLTGAVAAVCDALAGAQRALAADAHRRTAERTRAVATVAEAIEAAEDGFAKLPWAAVGPDGERELNAHAVSVRCLQTPDGGVPDDAAAGDLIAVVGRAY